MLLVRRWALGLLLGGVVVVLAGCSSSSEGLSAEDGRRPNVVVIMADDMGYSDIGAYGSEIDTPNLDRLARDGLLFTDFYNAARCVPTRTSLLTGRYPHEAGTGRMVSSVDSDPDPGPYQGYLNEQSATIAEVLRPAGYGTYMAGKWHVGEKQRHWPTKRGFDRYFGLISGASSYFRIIEDQPRTRQMALNGERWTPPDSGFYMTDAFSDYAVRWIDQHHERREGDPFFLYVAYTAPHWPLHALPKDIAKYEGAYDMGWDSLRARRYRRMQELGVITQNAELSERPEAIPAWEDVENKGEWSRRMAVYAAMIDRMDQGIGRILSALKEHGAAENTLILFMADNGGSHENIMGRNLHDPGVLIGRPGSFTAYRRPWANASNTPFRLFKSWAHEGGIATPLIVHWPKHLEQGKTDQVGHVMDIMPTILDAAEVEHPDTLNGRKVRALSGQSLLPVLTGEETGSRALYWEHIGNRAVRRGDWKMSYDRRRDQWELYNLEEDPTETRNLAGQYPERVQAMDSLWQGWADRVGVFPKP